MARRIVQETTITNSEAKHIIEEITEEGFGEFQRRTLEYTRKFSKLKPDQAEKLAADLSEKLQLERADAIQIVNNMPETVEELRAVLTVKGRFVTTEQLNGILAIMKRYL